MASMRPVLVSLVAAVASLGTAASCGGSVRAVFHPTDATFRPAPGARPQVYAAINAADVPRVPSRSVGTIEVTVPSSSGIQRALEVAADKGRELGCWIVVEEAAFAAARSRASLDHGAQAQLAHGGGGGHDEPARHGASPASDGSQTMAFHCVIQTAGTTAAWTR